MQIYLLFITALRHSREDVLSDGERLIAQDIPIFRLAIRSTTRTLRFCSFDPSDLLGFAGNASRGLTRECSRMVRINIVPWVSRVPGDCRNNSVLIQF